VASAGSRSLPGVGAGGRDQQRRASGLRLQALEPRRGCGCPWPEVPTSYASAATLTGVTTAGGHSWQFKARFRRHAFGWKSQPAIQRVREAVSEIRKAARQDGVLAADGAVALLERLSPALEQVDSS
jgi:hypothetical protein